MAVKKEDKNVKAIIDQSLLFDDQMSQLNENECIRCSSQGLLYDLKMRIILEYEEKVLRENSEQEVVQDDFHINPYRKHDHLTTINELTVPSVMRRLYPNINEERYYKLKSNVSLMNMMVKLCESCYLEATESILETKDDKKAKSTQLQIREKLKKNALKFGMQAFGKDAQSTVLENKSSQLIAKPKIDIDGPTHPQMLSLQGSQSHRAQSQMGMNSHAPMIWPQTAKTSRFTASEAKRPVRKLGNEEGEKVLLPFIASTKNENNKLEKTAQTKAYYFRASNHANSTDESQVKDNKTSFSPYAFELNLKTGDSSHRESVRPSKSVTALRKVNLNPNIPTTLVPVSTERKINNKSGQRYSMTSYSTMMSTIKDLKGYLSQNKEEIEEIQN